MVRIKEDVAVKNQGLEDQRESVGRASVKRSAVQMMSSPPVEISGTIIMIAVAEYP